ncbi:hypothetical protein SSX86_027640 [Deinandra increscens subsp. villosa]|uniref:Uncharacterized protein n=1 Tax=Deinandra increscens subsp. villosa TaxID=3103831 RepID=A0AAP0GKI5_9ASTR
MKSAHPLPHIPQIAHHLFTFFITRLSTLTHISHHQTLVSIETQIQLTQSTAHPPCTSSNLIDFMESLDGKLETPDSGNLLRSDHLFRHTGSLEILRETVRILRCNPTTFIAISALLIYPVSALHLLNRLIDQSVVRQIEQTLVFIVESSGLSSVPFVKQSCHKFAELTVSSIVSFPLYCTLLLVSKSAVVYSVECVYSRKKLVTFKFYAMTRKIWRRVISTYMLTCALLVGCLTLFLMVVICVSKLLCMIGFSPDSIACIAGITGLFFLVLFAHTVIVCDLCLVILMSEDVSGRQAMVRSSVLVKGQTRAGLMVFIGSTIGIAVVKGVLEHRVKSLSYGEGCLRIWERPVLVLVYSFVVLVDFMMSTVFFFSCKSYSLEAVECGM